MGLLFNTKASLNQDNGVQRPFKNEASLKSHMSKVKFISMIMAFAFICGACSNDDIFFEENSRAAAVNAVIPDSNCGTSINAFLKAEGNDKGNPLSKKVGDIFFRTEGDKLVVYLLADKKINNAGVIFGTFLADFDNAGILSGGGNSGNLADKNIIDGKVANYNADKREAINGGVKFTFAKSDLPKDLKDELLCIVYCNLGWGYGIPNGPSGTAGVGGLSTNNGQYIYVGNVEFCEEDDPDSW